MVVSDFLQIAINKALKLADYLFKIYNIYKGKIHNLKMEMALATLTQIKKYFKIGRDSQVEIKAGIVMKREVVVTKWKDKRYE